MIILSIEGDNLKKYKLTGLKKRGKTWMTTTSEGLQLLSSDLRRKSTGYKYPNWPIPASCSLLTSADNLLLTSELSTVRTQLCIYITLIRANLPRRTSFAAKKTSILLNLGLFPGLFGNTGKKKHVFLKTVYDARVSRPWLNVHQ